MNAFVIRLATADDEPALRALADAGQLSPLTGRVLVGELDGRPAAAMSLDDGRVVASRAPRVPLVRAYLRRRAGAIQAIERTPSLVARVRAAVSYPARAAA